MEKVNLEVVYQKRQNNLISMRKMVFIGLLNPKVSDSLQSYSWSDKVVWYTIRIDFEIQVDFW